MRAYHHALFLWMLAGCLPDPDQPVPGNVRVNLLSDDSFTGGFVTADGWTVEYERALIAIGFIRLWSDPERSEGERCHAAHEYSTEYTRVLDARREGEQRIATPYGLGPCAIGLQIWAGSDTVVLGEGVEEGDADRLRDPGDDPSAPQGPISLLISGRATRDGEEKRFEWEIRHAFDFERCASVTLERGGSTSVTFELDGAAIFRASDGSEPTFDEVAAADRDDDGSITLDELAPGASVEPLPRARFGAILVAPDAGCEARPIGPR